MEELKISDINYYIERIIYHSKLSQLYKDKLNYEEYSDSILTQNKYKYHIAKIFGYKNKINRILKQL